MLERIFFNVFAFAFFIFLFFKMIRKNDTNYIYILALQALGIAIGFIGLIFRLQLNFILMIITYAFSIILPAIVILIEKKGITLTEVIYLSMYKIYMVLGKEEEGKNIILKLISKDEKSYYGHKILAQIYEKEGNLQTAIEEYIRTVNIRPQDDNVKYRVADLFYKTGNSSESIKILNEILKKRPDWEDASLLLGDILYDEERFKEAVSVYLDALQYHPENYNFYYNLGMVYTRLNDFQSAKEYYEKAAELNSLLYHAKFNLGQIALLYNELEEAEQYFLECVQDEELEEDAYYYLAYIAMLKGDEQRAVQYLNVAVDENPEIYETIRKEVVFKMIFYKIDKPNKNKESKHKRIKPTKKEKETMKHLKNTCELVENLNHNDIKVMKIIQNKRKEEKERE